MPAYFVTVRSISGNAFTGSVGPPRYLEVPDDADTPLPSHAVSYKTWLNGVLATFARDQRGDLRGDLLCYVHGFNEDAKGVAQGHRLIDAGLKGREFRCTVISFDWPSAGTAFAYVEDTDSAKLTAVSFVKSCVRPLLAAQSPTCKVAVHALCHSMGAYVLREALDHADDGQSADTTWTLNQVALIGADVDAQDFVDGNADTESLLRHCYRLTNYFNLYDEVLQISNAKRLGVAPRLGRVGLPPDAPTKTVNVDCSKHYAGLPDPGGGPIAEASRSHGWYFQDAGFMADLANALMGSVDRTVVPGRAPVADSRTMALS